MNNLAADVVDIFAEAQHLGRPKLRHIAAEYGWVRPWAPGSVGDPRRPSEHATIEPVGVTRLSCPDCGGLVERRVGVRQAFHIARGSCRWIGVGLDVR